MSLSLDKGLPASSSYTHSNVWEAGLRLRIIGDPGSGKSTLVKRILREKCRRGMRSPRKSRLPLLLSMKDLTPPTENKSADELADWAVQHLRERVVKVPGYKMDQLFDRFVETSGILLLLDGLDEVASANYDKLVATVSALSARLTALGPNNAMLVTMRKNFYEQTRYDLDDALPQVLTVRPFTSNDIYEFVTRWPFNGAKKAEKANSIYGELCDRPNLRDMCRNPLILAMYVANYESVEEEADLPDTRTEFYSKVTKELLVLRRTRQSGSRTARQTLERQREQVLGSLALENMLDTTTPVNRVSWPAAIAAVRKVLGASTDDEAERSFNAIAAETGIVEDEQPGESLKFIHLTFCEYLAAIESIKGRRNGYAELLAAHKRLTEAGAAHERSRLLEVTPSLVRSYPSGPSGFRH